MIDAIESWMSVLSDNEGIDIQAGAGDDVFTFNVGDGADTITDFNTGNSGPLGDGKALTFNGADQSIFRADNTSVVCFKA